MESLGPICKSDSLEDYTRKKNDQKQQGAADSKGETLTGKKVEKETRGKSKKAIEGKKYEKKLESGVEEDEARECKEQAENEVKKIRKRRRMKNKSDETALKEEIPIQEDIAGIEKDKIKPNKKRIKRQRLFMNVENDEDALVDVESSQVSSDKKAEVEMENVKQESVDSQNDAPTNDKSEDNEVKNKKRKKRVTKKETVKGTKDTLVLCKDMQNLELKHEKEFQMKKVNKKKPQTSVKGLKVAKSSSVSNEGIKKAVAKMLQVRIELQPIDEMKIKFDSKKKCYIIAH